MYRNNSLPMDDLGYGQHRKNIMYMFTSVLLFLRAFMQRCPQVPLHSAMATDASFSLSPGGLEEVFKVGQLPKKGFRTAEC